MDAIDMLVKKTFSPGPALLWIPMIEEEIGDLRIYLPHYFTPAVFGPRWQIIVSLWEKMLYFFFKNTIFVLQQIMSWNISNI
jgi:hypothetical protein